MKIYCTLIVIILFFNNSIAQKILGTVKDINGNNILNSNILIKNKKNSFLISEYITSENGTYSINLKKKYDTVLIEIVSNGYLKDSHIINNPQKNRTYNVNFILMKNNNINLDEIVLNAKKRSYTIKKDTIKYNINSFRNGSEKKIQDVIKNLPGIEVNTSTGIIKYKGKSVETVLLEGDNLFGYNYSLGTKNINVDIVKQIQVIENYSENHLLNGIENNDKVVLNLKLKKNKIDFSGNVDLGAGTLDKREQLALNINSNILGITKNYKSFATISYNNVGTNQSPFDYFGFNMNFEQVKERDFIAQKYILETHFSNTLDDKRININNQFFGNYNAIFKINKRLKVKTNLYYVNDRITSEQLYKNQYTINEELFTTIDNSTITKKPKQYRGDLNVKYNTSKTSLIEYNYSMRQEDIKTPSLTYSNNNNKFESLLNTKDFYLKQKLLYTKKISKKKVLQFSAFQSTNNIQQIFKTTPSTIHSNNYSLNKQYVNTTKNYFKTQISLLGSTSKNSKYTFSIGGILDKNKLQSKLFNTNLTETATTEDNINNFQYSKDNFYQLGTYRLSIGKWEISPTYTLNYQRQELINKESNTKSAHLKFMIDPSININYRLNRISFLTVKASFYRNTNAERYIFTNQISINNRTTINNTPSLALRESTNYGLFYFNNDLYHQLQINLGINYQKIKGNFFTNSIIGENTTQINYFFLPQDKSSLTFNFLTAKYIPFFESTLKLSSNYSISKYKNMVNNSVLRDNRNQFINTKLFVKTAFDGLVNFENTINLLNSISKNENNNSQFTNETLNNQFTIIIKPVKRWVILFSSDYFLPNLKQKTKSYLFLDTTLRYQPKNKKIEFNFTAKNLLNENNFEQIQTSDFSTSIYRTNILPRYYLLNMSFNF